MPLEPRAPVVHTPVLLQEVIALLEPPPRPCLIVDATLGEGGHAEAFLERWPQARLIGVEVDPEIARIADARLARFGDRFRLWLGRFGEFFAGGHFEEAPDRVLFDLGISSYHYDASGRGFSFRSDEPLDMRLDPRQTLTASRLVNELPEDELAEILARYGEERYARSIARRIAARRSERPIERSSELAQIIRSAVPPSYRHGRIHPATRCFQALRIAVNDEIDGLEGALEAAVAALALGGRIAVIAFHSLEDRVVKTLFRRLGSEGARYRILTRKPIRPRAEETRANPRARSSRLRVLERVA